MPSPTDTTHPLSLARRFALLLLAALGLVTDATAHPVPFSYLDLSLDAEGLQGSLVVHDYDAAHELGLARPESLLDPAVARTEGARLATLLSPRLHIGLDAPATTPEFQELLPLPQRQSIRLTFRRVHPNSGEIRLNAQLFPYDPAHQTFVNLYEHGRLTQQAILDATHSTLTYYPHSVQGRRALVRTFVPAGLHHILIGPDHLLFLVGLLLLGGPVWRLAGIATAFTVGHSITLSLAALRLVNIPSRMIEPAIALSIVVVGIDNLLVRSERQRLPAPGTGRLRDLRPWLAGGFGLVHGFGFASVLLELDLPTAAMGWSLAAFNVGVEIGQLLVLVPVAFVLAGIRHRDERLADRSVVAGSIAVVLAGAVWFVQRIVWA